MENTQLKKFNIIYVVASYAVYLGLMAGCIALLEATGSMIFTYLVLIPMALIIWGPNLVFKLRAKSIEKELQAKGFNPNYTFRAKTMNFYMDLNSNQMAFVYKLNPTHINILSIKEAQNPRVNDFKAGKGIMEGSNMVALEFDVAGKRQRIHTFLSNKRFSMNSNQILDGISKADMMCERILMAQQSV